MDRLPLLVYVPPMAFFVMGSLLLSEATGRDTLIDLTAVNERAAVDLYAQNKTHGELTLIFDVNMTNMSATQDLPMTVTLSPHVKKRMVRLFPLDGSLSWHYRSSYKAAYGALDTKPQSAYLYRLPYEAGNAYPVIQTFDGPVSHYGESRFAVDFAMRQGSPVCAARPGRIVAVKSDSNRGGGNREFRDDGNFVYIRHADKTLGVYAHFKKEGVLVEPGDYVRQGQVIGLSGNTGWSSQPHLHFGVYKLIGADLGESVPFLFESSRGTVQKPQLGAAYEVKPEDDEEEVETQGPKHKCQIPNEIQAPRSNVRNRATGVQRMWSFGI